MQRPGTEAIRNEIQPSKQKREITKITNVSSHFPKGGHSATQTELKVI